MLHNPSKHYHLDSSAISLEKAKKIGVEYGELMILSTLSQKQEDRMDEILLLATHDSNVDFWVSQAACDRGADIGLLSPEMLEHYENQRAALRERIELDIPLVPVAETLLRQQVRTMEKETLDKLCGELGIEKKIA